MKKGNWIAIDKNLVNYLPKDRPFTELEAVFSYSLDIDKKFKNTIRGYSKLWRWDRKKVKRFMEDLHEIQRLQGDEKGPLTPHKKDHLLPTKRTTKGPLYRLINNDLSTLAPHKKDTKRTTYSPQKGPLAPHNYNPSTNTNPDNPNPNNGGKEKSVNCIYSEISDFWNSKKIIVHSDVEKSKSCINAKLKIFSVEEIKEAIGNYSKILEADSYFLTYRWTLKEFFTRDNGFEKFLAGNNPFENYLKTESKFNKSSSEGSGCPKNANKPEKVDNRTERQKNIDSGYQVEGFNFVERYGKN